MKTLFILAIALVSASAYARPNTANMSCSQANDLVQRSGAIVMSHGASYLYQRFVAHGGFCLGGEKAAAAYAKTLDSNSCKVGFVCVDGRDGGNSVVLPSKVLACKEGAYGSAKITDYYPDYNYSGREAPSITTVCRNGKYVPVNDQNWKIKHYPVKKCKDGATHYYPEPDRGNYSGVDKFVCSGGKWYKSN
ncbi:MAG: hypothetical protein M9962_03350 [Oligoflexia bacterium]|nr:hypothetical protein [Oligoflexia bacterium]